MKRQMPWFGWVGVILLGLAVLTAALEQAVTVRGVVIAVVGLVLCGVGFALRRPATPAVERATLPRL
jgi:uncharacterized membrane protein